MKRFTLVALALQSVGCVSGGFTTFASLSGGARDAFVKSETCPFDRVTVTPSSYRKPVLLDVTPAPADIAADPGRLALWNQQRDEARARATQAAANPGCDMFEVTGCGRRRVLCCGYRTGPDVGQGPVIYPNLVDCRQQPDSPG